MRTAQSNSALLGAINMINTINMSARFDFVGITTASDVVVKAERMRHVFIRHWPSKLVNKSACVCIGHSLRPEGYNVVSRIIDGYRLLCIPFRSGHWKKMTIFFHNYFQ